MQNIKTIGMRECVGTPKFALHQPCATMDRIGVVLRLLPKARTDNLIGDYIMKIPAGWIALETSHPENTGKQGENVTIDHYGNVRIGKKIQNLFTEKEFGGLSIPKGMPPKGCILRHGGTRYKNQIMIAFGTPQEMDGLREAQGSDLQDYQWNKEKNGITAKGSLRRLEIKEIDEMLDPRRSKDGVEYKWTETRYSDNPKTKDVVKQKTGSFLVKDGKKVTSLRFTKPKVDPENGTIIVSTKNMEYNTEDLQRQDVPDKISYSKVEPVTKGTG